MSDSAIHCIKDLRVAVFSIALKSVVAKWDTTDTALVHVAKKPRLICFAGCVFESPRNTLVLR